MAVVICANLATLYFFIDLTRDNRILRNAVDTMIPMIAPERLDDVCRYIPCELREPPTDA